jgi:hypothetical protein
VQGPGLDQVEGPTGVSNQWASSLMQKKVPAMRPWGVAIWAQLLYSKVSPGLSRGWWPTTARPRTSWVWSWPSVMRQWRATSCAVTGPVLRMVIV